MRTGIFVVLILLLNAKAISAGNLFSNYSNGFLLDSLHFIDPPQNVTISCEEMDSVGQSIQVVNTDPACPVNQMVAPSVTGNASLCGGVLIYNWIFTASCGTIISHTQTVTVAPAPQPFFINPPADITVTHDSIPTSIPEMQITNNSAGCSINGSIIPVVASSASTCGGLITYTWTYTDVCNRIIIHTQNITVLPVPQAQFVNPPADTIIDCSQYPLTTIPELKLTNNITGAGGINEIISPVVVDSVVNCKGFVDLIYSYTDFCGRNYFHKQRITINVINGNLEQAENSTIPFPNPTFDKLYFNTNESISVDVYDSFGRLKTYTRFEKYIDLSNYKPGSYYVRINGEKSRKVFKVVKI